jgi:hypothetical protein
VGWTSAPNVRGTIDIIWSCIFIVFLSTWTTLHVNVPPVKKSPLWRLQSKALLMGVGLIAPELVATCAFTELRTSLTVRSHMRDLGYEDWSLAQSFFVAMGGYMLRFNGDYKPISGRILLNGSAVVSSESTDPQTRVKVSISPNQWWNSRGFRKKT